MNYKGLTFLLLGILVIEIILIVNQGNQETIKCDNGKYIVMYSDLPQFEGVRVYYGSCVKPQGVSSSNLIKICENDICRNPYQEEIKQDRYLPQSFEK